MGKLFLGKWEETNRPLNAAVIETKAAETARPADTSIPAEFAAEPTLRLDILAPADRPQVLTRFRSAYQT